MIKGDTIAILDGAARGRTGTVTRVSQYKDKGTHQVKLSITGHQVALKTAQMLIIKL